MARSSDIIWQGTSEGLEQTLAIGAAVGRLAEAGDVIALNGELGAGKTQFVRGLADGLGIGRDRVSSPTFVMSQEYDAAEPGGLRLVHIDAYRLDGELDAETIGFDGVDDLGCDALVAVEWAQRVGDALGANVLAVSIEHGESDSRSISMAGGGRWAERSEALVKALDALDALGKPGTLEGTMERGLDSPDEDDSQQAELLKSTPCPICGKGATPAAESFPFCSPRCRQVDLGRWLNESYVISRPIEQSDLEQDD